MSEYFGLEGQVALVTGASSGLGAHFAQTLAAAGCVTIIAARREDRLQHIAAHINSDLKKSGGIAHPLVLDVSDRTAIDDAIARIEAAHGTPSIVVNNAGIAAPQGFINARAEDTAKTVEINQMAVWNVGQSAARAMIAKNQGGSIINIASIAGIAQLGGAAAYGMSKAAVIAMTKTQAQELARHNIRVNAIAPGYFETDMNRAFLNSAAGEKLIARIPMQRTGAMAELDGILLLLASERASFMTGAIIPVDGGHLTSSL